MENKRFDNLFAWDEHLYQFDDKRLVTRGSYDDLESLVIQQISESFVFHNL